MAEQSNNPMDFFLQQQAQFWADLQAMKERQEQTDRQIEKHDQQIAALAGITAQLAQAELRLIDRIEDNARAIRELREVVDKHEYKLNALVETVDKLVRRNGSAQ